MNNKPEIRIERIPGSFLCNVIMFTRVNDLEVDIRKSDGTRNSVDTLTGDVYTFKATEYELYELYKVLHAQHKQREEIQKTGIQFIAKDGHPVELIKGKHVKNIFRLLFLTRSIKFE